MSPPKARGTQLGRGLSALLGNETVNIPITKTNKGTDTANRGLTVMPVEFLVQSPLQPRTSFAQEEIDALAKSIRERGILQPILVRPSAANADEYEIIAGERRWRAAQAAQLHEVPIIIRELNDEEVLEVALIENIQRSDLNAIEEALGYRRLIDDFDHTQDSLATVLGKSRSHIANTLRLLVLPDGVKKLLAEGAISAGHARALIGAVNSKEIADEIVKKGLNVRQVEQLVKASKAESPATASRPKEKDPDTLALERSLTDVLGLRVEIDFSGNGGRIVVQYKNLDQLDDIIRRLSDGSGHFT